MDILLISGSVSGEKRYGKLKSVGSYMPPYGLLTIAGLLEEDGHTVQILDREIHPFSDEEIGKYRERQARPDWDVCFHHRIQGGHKDCNFSKAAFRYTYCCRRATYLCGF